MPRIKYVGPHTDGVDVPSAASAKRLTARDGCPDVGIWGALPGDEFEVSDEVAFGTKPVVATEGDVGDVIRDHGTSGLLTGDEGCPWEQVDKPAKPPVPLPPEDN